MAKENKVLLPEIDLALPREIGRNLLLKKSVKAQILNTGIEREYVLSEQEIEMMTRLDNCVGFVGQYAQSGKLFFHFMPEKEFVNLFGKALIKRTNKPIKCTDADGKSAEVPMADLSSGVTSFDILRFLKNVTLSNLKNSDIITNKENGALILRKFKHLDPIGYFIDADSIVCLPKSAYKEELLNEFWYGDIIE